jgi:hypothetical protein
MASETFDSWAILGNDEVTWKPVSEFEGVYEVSDDHRIRRTGAGKGIRVGRVLMQHEVKGGYRIVQLWKGGKPSTRLVHVLVATAFIGPVPDGQEVNHKDGDKRNNAPENLEYVTRSDNLKHAYRTGLMRRGEEHQYAKLDAESVAVIRRENRNGVGYRPLARRFGVSRRAIQQVIKGISWAHIPEEC